MTECFFCVFWRLSNVLLTKYDLMFIDFLIKCLSFTFFFQPQYFFNLHALCHYTLAMLDGGAVDGDTHLGLYNVLGQGPALAAMVLQH